MASADTALQGLDALEQPQAATASGPGSLVLVIWEFIAASGWKKLIFPAPGPTLANLWDQLGTGLLWHAIGTTLYRALIGFALALVIGAVIGALVSQIRPLRAAVGSLLTGLQTMPSIAWFPFAIILFGLTTQAIMFVIVLGAAPSVANGLIAGVDYTPPLLLKAGHMMGLRRLSLYRHVIIPASLPAFVAGLKQGWAFAWRSLMAGELLVVIANEPSLGVLLQTDQDQADMISATAIIIVILVIGIIVDSVFSAADRSLRRRWGLT
jgi:NitT/TauT family transport system permease protein